VLPGRSADVTTTAAAPSLVCDELPAVTVPVRVERRPQLRERLRDVSRLGPSSSLTFHVAHLGSPPDRGETTSKRSGVISSRTVPVVERGQRALVTAQGEGVLLLARDALSRA
jgi:hypothetical protein